MSRKIKFWYFTANVFVYTKESNDLLRKALFSWLCWSDDGFFPINVAFHNAVQASKNQKSFFDSEKEECFVQITNQMEISGKKYHKFIGTDGEFSKGGQLILV